MAISGYAAHPSQSRSHNRMQYFFLNGRHIRDRALQHALGEAYRGLMMVGRQPIAFLAMTMPPEMVDVNVHPTKLEVRFQDSGRLYSQLLATLRGKFLTTDLNTHVHTAGGIPRRRGRRRSTAATTPRKPPSCGSNWSIGLRAKWRRGRGEGRGRGRDTRTCRGPTARGESPDWPPRPPLDLPAEPPWRRGMAVRQ